MTTRALPQFEDDLRNTLASHFLETKRDDERIGVFVEILAHALVTAAACIARGHEESAKNILTELVAMASEDLPEACARVRLLPEGEQWIGRMVQ